jgi:hypothetical protein
MRPSIMIAAALAAGLSAPASAEDAYVVGITAALTGPPASTYAPAVEALRLYLERVNAAGGAEAPRRDRSLSRPRRDRRRVRVARRPNGKARFARLTGRHRVISTGRHRVI